LAPAAVAVSPAADLKAVLPGSKGPKVPPPEAIYCGGAQALPRRQAGRRISSFSPSSIASDRRPSCFDYVTKFEPDRSSADDRSGDGDTGGAFLSSLQSTRRFHRGQALLGRAQCHRRARHPYAPLLPPIPITTGLPGADGSAPARLLGPPGNLGYVAAFARGGVDLWRLGATTGRSASSIARPEDAQPFFDGLGQPAVYPSIT